MGDSNYCSWFDTLKWIPKNIRMSKLMNLQLESCNSIFNIYFFSEVFLLPWFFVQNSNNISKQLYTFWKRKKTRLKFKIVQCWICVCQSFRHWSYFLAHISKMHAILNWSALCSLKAWYQNIFKCWVGIQCPKFGIFINQKGHFKICNE